MCEMVFMSKTTSSPSCVDKLKILADTTRLSVLESLMTGPSHVGELAQRLGVEQTLMSHHLKVLRDGGLVEARREGKSIQYRLAADVAKSRSAKSINLGCCRLSFKPTGSKR